MSAFGIFYFISIFFRFLGSVFVLGYFYADVIDARLHAHPAVRQNQCYQKCGNGKASGVPSCAGYNSAIHVAGSKHLCLSIVDMQNLCSEMADCSGVAIENRPWTNAESRMRQIYSSSRYDNEYREQKAKETDTMYGKLLERTCTISTQEESTGFILRKTTTARGTCSEHLAVEVTAVSLPRFAGLYYPNTTNFQRIDNVALEQLEWNLDTDSNIRMKWCDRNCVANPNQECNCGFCIQEKAASGEWQDVYTNYDVKQCTSSRAPDASMLDSKDWYFVRGYHQPTSVNIQLSCPDRQPNHYYMVPNQMCAMGNIDVSTYHATKEHSCHYKCGYMSSEESRQDPYCMGLTESYTRDDGEICANRMKCEEICSGIEECVGIDMHKYLPRCYLNKKIECNMETLKYENSDFVHSSTSSSWPYTTTYTSYIDHNVGTIHATTPLTNLKNPLGEYDYLVKDTAKEAATKFGAKPFYMDPPFWTRRDGIECNDPIHAAKVIRGTTHYDCIKEYNSHCLAQPENTDVADLNRTSKCAAYAFDFTAMDCYIHEKIISSNCQEVYNSNTRRYEQSCARTASNPCASESGLINTGNVDMLWAEWTPAASCDFDVSGFAEDDENGVYRLHGDEGLVSVEDTPRKGYAIQASENCLGLRDLKQETSEMVRDSFYQCTDSNDAAHEYMVNMSLAMSDPFLDPGCQVAARHGLLETHAVLRAFCPTYASDDYTVSSDTSIADMPVCMRDDIQSADLFHTRFTRICEDCCEADTKNDLVDRGYILEYDLYDFGNQVIEGLSTDESELLSLQGLLPSQVVGFRNALTMSKEVSAAFSSATFRQSINSVLKSLFDYDASRSEVPAWFYDYERTATEADARQIAAGTCYSGATFATYDYSAALGSQNDAANAVAATGMFHLLDSASVHMCAWKCEDFSTFNLFNSGGMFGCLCGEPDDIGIESSSLTCDCSEGDFGPGESCSYKTPRQVSLHEAMVFAVSLIPVENPENENFNCSFDMSPRRLEPNERDGNNLTVLCPDQNSTSYCDCSGDCTMNPSYCTCDKAVACCASARAHLLPPWYHYMYESCDSCTDRDALNYNWYADSQSPSMSSSDTSSCIYQWNLPSYYGDGTYERPPLHTEDIASVVEQVRTHFIDYAYTTFFTAERFPRDGSGDAFPREHQLKPSHAVHLREYIEYNKGILTDPSRSNNAMCNALFDHNPEVLNYQQFSRSSDIQRELERVLQAQQSLSDEVYKWGTVLYSPTSKTDVDPIVTQFPNMDCDHPDALNYNNCAWACDDPAALNYDEHAHDHRDEFHNDINATNYYIAADNSTCIYRYENCSDPAAHNYPCVSAPFLNNYFWSGSPRFMPATYYDSRTRRNVNASDSVVGHPNQVFGSVHYTPEWQDLTNPRLVDLNEGPEGITFSGDWTTVSLNLNSARFEQLRTPSNRGKTNAPTLAFIGGEADGTNALQIFAVEKNNKIQIGFGAHYESHDFNNADDCCMGPAGDHYVDRTPGRYYAACGVEHLSETVCYSDSDCMDISSHITECDTEVNKCINPNYNDAPANCTPCFDPVALNFNPEAYPDTTSESFETFKLDLYDDYITETYRTEALDNYTRAAYYQDLVDALSQYKEGQKTTYKLEYEYELYTQLLYEANAVERYEGDDFYSMQSMQNVTNPNYKTFTDWKAEDYSTFEQWEREWKSSTYASPYDFVEKYDFAEFQQQLYLSSLLASYHVERKYNVSEGFDVTPFDQADFESEIGYDFSVWYSGFDLPQVIFEQSEFDHWFNDTFPTLDAWIEADSNFPSFEDWMSSSWESSPYFLSDHIDHLIDDAQAVLDLPALESPLKEDEFIYEAEFYPETFDDWNSSNPGYLSFDDWESNQDADFFLVEWVADHHEPSMCIYPSCNDFAMSVASSQATNYLARSVGDCSQESDDYFFGACSTCTDPNALNYNAAAVETDINSCEYVRLPYDANDTQCVPENHKLMTEELDFDFRGTSSFKTVQFFYNAKTLRGEIHVDGRLNAEGSLHLPPALFDSSSTHYTRVAHDTYRCDERQDFNTIGVSGGPKSAHDALEASRKAQHDADQASFRSAHEALETSKSHAHNATLQRQYEAFYNEIELTQYNQDKLETENLRYENELLQHNRQVQNDALDYYDAEQRWQSENGKVEMYEQANYELYLSFKYNQYVESEYSQVMEYQTFMEQNWDSYKVNLYLDYVTQANEDYNSAYAQYLDDLSDYTDDLAQYEQDLAQYNADPDSFSSPPVAPDPMEDEPTLEVIPQSDWLADDSNFDSFDLWQTDQWPSDAAYVPRRDFPMPSAKPFVDQTAFQDWLADSANDDEYDSRSDWQDSSVEVYRDYFERMRDEYLELKYDRDRAASSDPDSYMSFDDWESDASNYMPFGVENTELAWMDLYDAYQNYTSAAGVGSSPPEVWLYPISRYSSSSDESIDFVTYTETDNPNLDQNLMASYIYLAETGKVIAGVDDSVVSTFNNILSESQWYTSDTDGYLLFQTWRESVRGKGMLLEDWLDTDPEDFADQWSQWKDTELEKFAGYAPFEYDTWMETGDIGVKSFDGCTTQPMSMYQSRRRLQDAGTVLCSGQSSSDYCDCASDCTENPSFCACSEAVSCCGQEMDIFRPRHGPTGVCGFSAVTFHSWQSQSQSAWQRSQSQSTYGNTPPYVSYSDWDTSTGASGPPSTTSFEDWRYAEFKSDLHEVDCRAQYEADQAASASSQDASGMASVAFADFSDYYSTMCDYDEWEGEWQAQAAQDAYLSPYISRQDFFDETEYGNWKYSNFTLGLYRADARLHYEEEKAAAYQQGQSGVASVAFESFSDWQGSYTYADWEVQWQDPTVQLSYLSEYVSISDYLYYYNFAPSYVSFIDRAAWDSTRTTTIGVGARRDTNGNYYYGYKFFDIDQWRNPTGDPLACNVTFYQACSSDSDCPFDEACTDRGGMSLAMPMDYFNELQHNQTGFSPGFSSMVLDDIYDEFSARQYEGTFYYLSFDDWRIDAGLEHYNYYAIDYEDTENFDIFVKVEYSSSTNWDPAFCTESTERSTSEKMPQPPIINLDSAADCSYNNATCGTQARVTSWTTDDWIWRLPANFMEGAINFLMVNEGYLNWCVTDAHGLQDSPDTLLDLSDQVLTDGGMPRPNDDSALVTLPVDHRGFTISFTLSRSSSVFETEQTVLKVLGDDYGQGGFVFYVTKNYAVGMRDTPDGNNENMYVTTAENYNSDVGESEQEESLYGILQAVGDTLDIVFMYSPETRLARLFVYNEHGAALSSGPNTAYKKVFEGYFPIRSITSGSVRAFLTPLADGTTTSSAYMGDVTNLQLVNGHSLPALRAPGRTNWDCDTGPRAVDPDACQKFADAGACDPSHEDYNAATQLCPETCHCHDPPEPVIPAIPAPDEGTFLSEVPLTERRLQKQSGACVWPRNTIYGEYKRSLETWKKVFTGEDPTPGVQCPSQDVPSFVSLNQNFWGLEPTRDVDVDSSLQCTDIAVCPANTMCHLPTGRWHVAVLAKRGRVTLDSLVQYTDLTYRKQLLKEASPQTLAYPERVEGWYGHKYKMHAWMRRSQSRSTTVKLLSFFGEYLIAVSVLPNKAGEVASIEDYARQVKHFGRTFPRLTHMKWWSTDVLRLENFDRSGEVFNGQVELEWYVPNVQHFKVFRHPFGGGAAVDIEAEGGSIVEVDTGLYKVTLMQSNGDFIGVDDHLECAERNRGNCHPYSHCVERINQTPLCQCLPSYAIASDGVTTFYDPEIDSTEQCVLTGMSTSRIMGDYKYQQWQDQMRLSIRFENLDLVAGGWGISAIMLYSDVECRNLINGNSRTNPLENICTRRDTSTIARGTSRADQDWHVITSGSVSSQFSPCDIFNEPGRDSLQSRKRWWSKKTYSNAGESWVELLIPADQTVQCARIFSQQDHKAHWIEASMRLSEGDGCSSINKNLPDCPAMRKWRARSECPNRDFSYNNGVSDLSCHAIPFTVGNAHQKLTGELVEVPYTKGVSAAQVLAETHHGVLEFDNVPGPLQCAAKCEMFHDEGCAYFQYEESSSPHSSCSLYTSYRKITTFTPSQLRCEFAWRYPNECRPDQEYCKCASDFVWGFAGARIQVKTNPSVVVAGSPFSITIHGIGVGEGGMKFQRIKLIPDRADTRTIDEEDEWQTHMNSADCVTDQHTEFIENIFCATSPISVETYPGHFEEQHHYTVCSPAPTDYEAGSATWTKLLPRMTTETRTYRVCYCNGRNCLHGENWQLAEDRVTVSPDTDSRAYSYTLTEIVTTDSEDVTITVTSADASEQFSHAELKIVPESGDCEQSKDAAIADSYCFENVCFTPLWFEPTQAYQRKRICFRNAPNAAFVEIFDNAYGSLLEISPGTGIRRHGFRTGQGLSIQAGQADQSFALKAYNIQLPTTGRVMIKGHSPRGDNCARPNVCYKHAGKPSVGVDLTHGVALRSKVNQATVVHHAGGVNIPDVFTLSMHVMIHAAPLNMMPIMHLGGYADKKHNGLIVFVDGTLKLGIMPHPDSFAGDCFDQETETATMSACNFFRLACAQDARSEQSVCTDNTRKGDDFKFCCFNQAATTPSVALTAGVDHHVSVSYHSPSRQYNIAVDGVLLKSGHIDLSKLKDSTSNRLEFAPVKADANLDATLNWAVLLSGQHISCATCYMPHERAFHALYSMTTATSTARTDSDFDTSLNSFTLSVELTASGDLQTKQTHYVLATFGDAPNALVVYLEPISNQRYNIGFAKHFTAAEVTGASRRLHTLDSSSGSSGSGGSGGSGGSSGSGSGSVAVGCAAASSFEESKAAGCYDASTLVESTAPAFEDEKVTVDFFYDGDNLESALYVDGVLQATPTLDLGDISGTTAEYSMEVDGVTIHSAHMVANERPTCADHTVSTVHAVSLNPGMSTGDSSNNQMQFTLDRPIFSTGRYDVCACEDKPFEYHERNLHLEDELIPLALGDIGADWQQYVGQQNCYRTCEAHDCNCDAFDGDFITHGIGMNVEGCLHACLESTGCHSVQVKRDALQCMLMTMPPTPTPTTPASNSSNSSRRLDSLSLVGGVYLYNDNDYDMYVKNDPLVACHPTTKVGEAVVTKMAAIGHEYILTSGQEGSIEVVAPREESQWLTSKESQTAVEDSDIWLRGRVMIIGCEGVCGISKAVTSMSFSDDDGAVPYPRLAPFPYYNQFKSDLPKISQTSKKAMKWADYSHVATTFNIVVTIGEAASNWMVKTVGAYTSEDCSGEGEYPSVEAGPLTKQLWGPESGYETGNRFWTPSMAYRTFQSGQPNDPHMTLKFTVSANTQCIKIVEQESMKAPSLVVTIEDRGHQYSVAQSSKPIEYARQMNRHTHITGFKLKLREEEYESFQRVMWKPISKLVMRPIACKNSCDGNSDCESGCDYYTSTGFDRIDIEQCEEECQRSSVSVLTDCKGGCKYAFATASSTLPALPYEHTCSITAHQSCTIDDDCPSGEECRNVHARDYHSEHGFFCPQDRITIDHDEALLSPNNCFAMCAQNSERNGEYDPRGTLCTGFYDGYDQLSGEAFCGHRAAAQMLCDEYTARNPDNPCTAISMHQSLPRFMLHHGQYCNTFHRDRLTHSDQWEMLLEVLDPVDNGNWEDNGGSPTARAQEDITGPYDGHDSDYFASPLQQFEEDNGFSWSALQRFKTLTASQGGTYRICYCDPTLAAEFGRCRSDADYSVDLGRLHVSGLSCLLDNRMYYRNRMICTEQFFGGMRCYAEEDSLATPSWTPWDIRR